MKLEIAHTWSIRIDVAASTEGGRPYRKHVNVLVMAATAERAIELVRGHFPESSVWAVNHVHKDAIVLVDDDAPEGRDG